MAFSAEKPTFISVTVDKSHIITIGERLYTESIELIRELVNNAYDADATRVDVQIEPQEITIRDNGMGMDFKGLQQYFNIGSTEKKIRSKSPKLHRDRIGQFGIGKFASLTACQQFEVITQRGDFRARVIFDKEEWERSADRWELPLRILDPDSNEGDGTRVVLRNLVRQFDLEEVRRRLTESVPLKAPNFEVFLNGQKVNPRCYSGHKIGILEGTRFGPIFGEIVILPSSQVFDEDSGIQIKVKQVTICRELFGLEGLREAVERIRGEVHADFLPVTSDRTGFIKDSPEYLSFTEVMIKVIADARKKFLALSNSQEKRRASRALNEVLERITSALNKNPEFAPFGMTPSGAKEGGGAVGPANGAISVSKENSEGEAASKKERKKRIAVKRLSPDAIIKRFRMGSTKIVCCLDRLGPEGPECQTQGNAIYVNRDHPLYLQASRKPSTYTWHIARLLTQEITLMKNPSTPRQAFIRQSRLLKDAFVEVSYP
jgi:hypothetical protein